jgi:DNA ligase (NAD+)
MLSLAKTKSEKEIYDFIGGKEHIAMLKMDGLTCSLTYREGNLVAAETRGNGIIGENILHNALTIPSIPKSIGIKEEVIVDGEIISTYTNFKNWEDKYANPRNFAAGSIRLLDSHECAERGLTFVAWDRINAPESTMSETFRLLDSLGFEVVPYLVNDFDIEELKKVAQTHNYPIDGLVVKYNDRAYGESLGRTSHHFNNGIAFKFGDDSATSTLTGIDYEVSRNGILTPVAVFEEIELEGSTVSRASLHNLSIKKELLGIPYIGQEVEVVKQNMIIPQIISAVKRCPEDFNEDSSTMILLPTLCPVCGEPLEIVCENESEVLMCKNLNCSCRIINQLDYFCGKKGLDIKGLSKATLEKLLNWGWINSLSDIFELKNHRDEWIRKPGFGPKSVDNILNAIEASKECEWTSYLAAFGIPLIGPNVIKELTKYFNSWDEFIAAIDNNFDFYNLPTFGYEKHKALHSYNYEEAKSLLEKHIIFKVPEVKEVVTTADSVSLEGKTFVVTGKLTHFKNRSELENKIAANGGKVTSSVSKKTNYLINNDFNSDSAKNRAAKAAGIPIVTEEEFINLFGIM